jgi:ABC-type Na+ efflux pump permease subunit
MTQTNLVVLALTPLIAWRIYKRMQRLTTRQQSRMWRHWTGVIAFSLAVVAFAVLALGNTLSLAALAGGAAAGATLGMLALRRTGFERAGSEFFYTPYAPIGIVISMLLIARIGYRVFELMAHGPAQAPDFGKSPLTMLIFGAVAGYYVAYSSGLLRWRHAERAQDGKQ